MSDKVTVSGLTTWPYPRSKMVVVFAVIGVACVCGGIYGASASGGTETLLMMIFVILFGSCFGTFGFYNVGSSEIVFDDNTKSIYLDNKRWCYQRKSTTELGPYSEFKECVLKEELSAHDGDGPRKMMYSIDFIFTDGPKNNGESDSGGKEEKARTVASINEWWKTTPHYKANQPTQPQPVQMVLTPMDQEVEQPVQVVVQHEMVYEPAPTQHPSMMTMKCSPAPQGQVEIVYAQEPVAGQPVVVQPVAGQPVVVVQQPMQQQQAAVRQGDAGAPPPSYESAQ